MKRTSVVLSTAMILLFASCGSGKSDKEETKDTVASATATDTAVAVTPKVTEPVFTPFKVIFVRHKVKNFAKWKPAYLAHDSARQASGLTPLALGRGLADSNLVVVVNKFSDVAKAKQFATSPGLKTAMQKSGVVGPPKISYIDVIRNDDSKVDQKERLLIAHKVKDFDKWLKAYDAEGKDARAANGIVDRGLGRGVDDPNTVYILFVVTDLAKAKARSSSPELKKIMTEAGVVGPPEVLFFKVTE